MIRVSTKRAAIPSPMIRGRGRGRLSKNPSPVVSRELSFRVAGGEGTAVSPEGTAVFPEGTIVSPEGTGGGVWGGLPEPEGGVSLGTPGDSAGDAAGVSPEPEAAESWETGGLDRI
jgi:hypothetical protein